MPDFGSHMDGGDGGVDRHVGHRVTVNTAVVGRCKLHPGLKASPVPKFDCEKDNSAFNLKPGWFV